jgi:hypothetical protein
MHLTLPCALHMSTAAVALYTVKHTQQACKCYRCRCKPPQCWSPDLHQTAAKHMLLPTLLLLLLRRQPCSVQAALHQPQFKQLQPHLRDRCLHGHSKHTFLRRQQLLLTTFNCAATAAAATNCYKQPHVLILPVRPDIEALPNSSTSDTTILLHTTLCCAAAAASQPLCITAALQLEYQGCVTAAAAATPAILKHSYCAPTRHFLLAVCCCSCICRMGAK